MPPPINVVIEREALHPFGDDLLQRIATVYLGGLEYRLLAPPRASGDALDWLLQSDVRIPNPESFGSEIVITGADRNLVISVVKEEIERRRANKGTSAEATSTVSARPKLTDPLPKTQSRLREEMEYWVLHQNDGQPGSDYWQSVEARLVQLRHLDLTMTAGQKPEPQSHHGLLVFISHSSQDESLAKALIDLLRSGVGLQNDQIRCSSVDGYRLPVGVHSEDQLRDEVKAAQVVVGLITPNSLNSHFVMFELGARWGTERFLAPLLAGVKAGELQQPLGLLNALKANNASQLHQLIADVAEQLGRKPQTPASYQIELEVVRSFADATASAKRVTARDFTRIKGHCYTEGDDDEICPRCADVDGVAVHLLDMNVDGKALRATCPECKTAISNKPPISRKRLESGN